MYEQMKNEFMMELSTRCNLNTEQLRDILSCLDCTMYNYDVKQKETSIVPYNQELPQLAKMFIVCKSIEGYAEGTLENYRYNLTDFFYAIQKAPEQVTANDIRVYLYNYQKDKNVSNRTLDKIRGNIAVFYNWMNAEGYIDKNPCVTVPKIKYEKKPKQACTQVDLEYLRRACETLKQRAILEFMYSTGCRVGELVILKKSDINWETKEVHLFGKGKKHRTSYMNAKAEVALKEYLTSRTDNNEWLFVSDRRPYNQMHVDGIQKIIRLMTERAKDGVTKHVTPHVLRHTFATQSINNGANLLSVQKLLGHSNINTTLTYLHTNMEDIKRDHLKSVV